MKGFLLLLACALLTAPALVPAETRPSPATLKLGPERPVVAIWRDSEGRQSGAPYLRIAIWGDGRVLFAADPQRWGHSLREGKLSREEVSRLRKEIAKTGVFSLTGTAYLVPDAPVDCVALDFGKRKQMLYWDEVETPNYGINIDPKPHHRKFKETWKAVNRLALAARPKQSRPVSGRFDPPREWRLKPAIQSE
ncbi:MAG: hypothetical protein ACK47B_07740 [Armatimonadota bacterium]